MTQTLQECASELMRKYLHASEERIAQLMLEGVPLDRLAFVTHADCKACRGAGFIFTSEGFSKERDGYQLSLSTCPLCPGLTVTPEAEEKRLASHDIAP